jgi:hypothetical protein
MCGIYSRFLEQKANQPSMAKRGADEMADRYLIENREAAVGVQMFHMRQRWGAAVWRAQTQVLLGRPKYALPGWEEAESCRAADKATEASWRSHASGSGDGGGLGGDSSWGAADDFWAERSRKNRPSFSCRLSLMYLEGNAKAPNVAGVWSDRPKLGRCPVQP